VILLRIFPCSNPSGEATVKIPRPAADAKRGCDKILERFEIELVTNVHLSLNRLVASARFQARLGSRPR
jgi:hypothetical protein